MRTHQRSSTLFRAKLNTRVANKRHPHFQLVAAEQTRVLVALVISQLPKHSSCARVKDEISSDGKRWTGRAGMGKPGGAGCLFSPVQVYQEEMDDLLRQKDADAPGTNLSGKAIIPLLQQNKPEGAETDFYNYGSSPEELHYALLSLGWDAEQGAKSCDVPMQVAFRPLEAKPEPLRFGRDVTDDVLMVYFDPDSEQSGFLKANNRLYIIIKLTTNMIKVDTEQWVHVHQNSCSYGYRNTTSEENLGE
ncbi:hypothetical protein IHE44_0001263, partial [Lamprotornis superbus]